MKFFERVKNTVRNNKKATASYALAAIFLLIGGIFISKAESKSNLESAGAASLMVGIMIALSTFFAQKCCPNACVRKTPEQLVLERTSPSYRTMNEEDKERDKDLDQCCANL